MRRQLAFLVLIIGLLPYWMHAAWASSFNTNLIVNPGAETWVKDGLEYTGPAPTVDDPETSTDDRYHDRVLPGWNDTNSLVTCENYALYNNPDPAVFPPETFGDNMFMGGYNMPSSGYAFIQTIDVSDLAEVIDTGLGYVISGWFGGYNTQTDVCQLVLTFKAEDGTSLGNEEIGVYQSSDWGNTVNMVFRSSIGTVPANTRSIEVALIFNPPAGFHNGMADNLSLILTPLTTFDSNLIINPGAETWVSQGQDYTGPAPAQDDPETPEDDRYIDRQLSGWNDEEGLVTCENYECYNNPDPVNFPSDIFGYNMFMGGYNVPASGTAITQVIDVSDRQWEINQGVNYEISGYFGGYESQTDVCQMAVIFRDPNGVSLGSDEIGVYQSSDWGDYVNMVYRSAAGTLPVDTQSVEVVLQFNAPSGFHNGMADNLSLTLHHEVLNNPIPADGAERVEPNVYLNWDIPNPDIFPDATYNVYLGLDPNLSEADLAVSDLAGPGYNPPGGLLYVTQYFWRVDINGSSTYTGDVWTFTTGGKAWNPTPADGVENVTPGTQYVSWQGDSFAASFDVFFGADPETLSDNFWANVTGSSPVQLPPLERFHNYYWRVDQKNAVGEAMIPGDTWCFSTGAAEQNGECEFMSLPADLNHDCFVNLYDLEYLAWYWLKGCNWPTSCNGADVAPRGGDGIVNLNDFTTFAAQYYTTSPYPEDSLTTLYEQAARYILDQMGTTNRGYCLVFGGGEGRLAYELAKRSGFTMLAVEEDDAKVNLGRSILEEADVYGERITLHKSSLDSLRYTDYAAALVVSDSIIADGECTGSAAEMYRMVRPHGGVALIGQPSGCPNELNRSDLENWLNDGGLSYQIIEDPNGLWARIDRGPLPGAGEWTQVWANNANTHCSGDTRITNNSQVLWFGEPGPGIMVDRHWRPAPPLYKAGKLITPGFDVVVCSDAYNGARLWDLTVPNSARAAVVRNCGGITMDNDYVYIAAEEKCVKVSLDTGLIEDTFQVSQDMHWGYLAVDDGLLIGSEQLPFASYIAARWPDYVGPDENRQASHFDGRPLITSKTLFCRNKNSGETLWIYDNNSVIAHPTICIGGDDIYFIESLNPDAVNDADGRVYMVSFNLAGDDEFLVKINKYTGTVEWRQQVNLPFYNIMHLSYAEEMLIAAGTYYDPINNSLMNYDLYAYRTSDGSEAWTKNLAMIIGGHDHGVQDKHPMIIGETVYLKYGSWNILTGNPENPHNPSNQNIPFTFGTSNCADCSSSATHIFSRYNNMASIFDLGGNGVGAPLCSTMRPGCYISIIPAGGLILLPPYSAGCTCGYHTLQTTIAWLPQ